MGALTNIYVATSSGSDISGDGSSGNPYKTVQAGAFTLGTRDATNGNYVNISGDNVLAASLNYTTWGSPTATAQTVLRNWIGGPDGQGGLNGNAGNFTISAAKAYVNFQGLLLHNTGSATIISTGGGGTIIAGCEIYTSTATPCIDVGNDALVIGNNIYNCSTYLRVNNFGKIFNNYFSTGPTNKFTRAIYCSGIGYVYRNIITVDGSANGIESGSGEECIWENSILSSSGTGSGILVPNAGVQVFNNLVEGFSGAGGVGINPSTDVVFIYNNAVYNCTTAYGSGDQILANDNETLSASPFAKSGSNTFANRFTYFAPVAGGNVLGGAYPTS